MLRLYTQLIGLPLKHYDGGQTLGRILHPIVDPDTGRLAALTSFGGRVVAPIDLTPFNGECWEVRTADALIEEDDLVRLQEIPRKKRVLVGKKVITESGERLGRVLDYVMDMDTLTLTHLYATQRWLITTLKRRIIEHKDILEINESHIVVRDNDAFEQERVEQFLIHATRAY